MKNWKKLLCILLTMLMVMLLAACGNGGQGEAAPPEDGTADVEPEADVEKVLTYAFGSTWGSLVPYVNSTAYTVVTQGMIYDKLVRINENGDCEPRAAESWEVSEDGKTFTFHMREDHYWSDGTPCTANDWVFCAEFFTDPEVEAPRKSYYGLLTGVDPDGTRNESEPFGIYAPDDYTLVMELDDPSYIEVFMGNNWNYYLAMPEHVMADMDKATWTEDPYWLDPLSNGPFTYTSEVSGQEIVFSANPDYYFDLAIDTLIIRVMDPSNFASAMISGEIDACYPYLTVDEATGLTGTDGIVVTENDKNCTLMFMSMNVNNVPKEVRQAISLAIDKERIVEQLILGRGEATSNWMMSSSPYYNEDLSYKRDLDKAKELLAASGWDTNTVLSFGVTAGIREKVGVLIQQDLAELGINIEITSYDGTTLFAGMRDGSIDCGLATWTHSPGNPIFFEDLLDPGTMNFANIKDDTYMPLINAAKAEQDVDVRIQDVKDLEALVAEESAYVPLYHEHTFILTSPRVIGITAIHTEAPWIWDIAE